MCIHMIWVKNGKYTVIHSLYTIYTYDMHCVLCVIHIIWRNTHNMTSYYTVYTRKLGPRYPLFTEKDNTNKNFSIKLKVHGKISSKSESISFNLKVSSIVEISGQGISSLKMKVSSNRDAQRYLTFSILSRILWEVWLRRVNKHPQSRYFYGSCRSYFYHKNIQ